MSSSLCRQSVRLLPVVKAEGVSEDRKGVEAKVGYEELEAEKVCVKGEAEEENMVIVVKA